MKTLRKVLMMFALAATVFCMAFSCGGSDEGGGNTQPEIKIVPTNVVLPSTLEFTEGENITFSLRGKTNVSGSDAVLLRSASNTDFTCPIVSVSDGSSLVIRTPEGLVSGSYKVYIQHDGANYYVGTVILNILKPINVEPGEGVTVYGIVQCDGKGVPDVLVSDGADIVKTDKDGIYQLKSEKKWKYVFVILPSGYESPTDGILPEFHAALEKNPGIAERKDFELKKVNNDNFTLFVLGDMHLAKRNDDLSQFAGVAKTLNSSISKAGGKTYCLTLGDMTWDVYWYDNKYTFPEYLQTANENFKDITFFHTMGNHDNDMNSVGDFDKSFRYTRDIAPTFYSFNLGQAHFIVLDNIDYNKVGANNDGAGKDYRDQYVLDYTAEQMTWLKKDLSYVDKNTPVFITSHAPLSRPTGATTFNDKYMNGADAPGEANMGDFIAAVSEYNVHFLSGHTHNLFHRTHSGKLSEHNEGAICASWWWSGSSKVTPGLHLSQDGTPGGYGVWKFTGKDVKYSYQSAGHDEKYQFRAYDMNEVKKVVTMDAAGGNSKFTPYYQAVQNYPANTVLVNVWDWDDSWKISITENGKELDVTRSYAYDPAHIMALSAPRCKATASPNFLTTQWCHFFQAKASGANSTVTVKVTDRNGTVFTETMGRPKAFKLDDYKNQ